MVLGRRAAGARVKIRSQRAMADPALAEVTFMA